MRNIERQADVSEAYERTKKGSIPELSALTEQDKKILLNTAFSHFIEVITGAFKSGKITQFEKTNLLGRVNEAYPEGIDPVTAQEIMNALMQRITMVFTTFNKATSQGWLNLSAKEYATLSKLNRRVPLDKILTKIAVKGDPKEGAWILIKFAENTKTILVSPVTVNFERYSL